MAQAGAYYNEIDPYAADWLRNLIAAGHIAPGDVDERSIEDVHPDDLRSYTQCHFFAGIGVWSYALRRAGWPDDRPVWTGSCPCQPFSAAGKGTAFDDERHLWPAWHWLIQECRPAVVFGEQVASKDAEPWLDLVSTDLEALAFAVAACAFPSASIGAPHIRDRTYFVAHAAGPGSQGRQRSGQRAGSQQQAAERSGRIGGVENTQHGGLEAGKSERRRPGAAVSPSPAGQLAHADGGHAGAKREQRGGEQRQQSADSGTGDLANAPRSGRREERADAGRRHGGDLAQGLAAGPGDGGRDLRPGPVNGFWRAADWLLCRDGKWRPVEPGTFPLAHGAPSRVGSLRAYGNAINAQQAQIFIEESMRCI
ncbi:DNA cytosine methyltransferase [Achromobacter denitrificans]|uniref:DNA cytosine methyltransferase n=1 Tax=Achromobacter denitrificans TaxID=32002 RepID=UPI000F682668|nr:DNA cytosine methyltransferase [Achromobacter denitrificans]RSE85538.1 DNA cytosine methyltransferase [Achromobacter denitrificans]